uniref:chloride channel protein n=1 Tax=Ningiella ruwaisensis TaxID=2364274 RepID=UPI001F4F7F48|nr:chloride channel protein [Ningiella ruwaisensis]
MSSRSQMLQSLRAALSHPSTSVQLCLVGLAGGLIAAFVIIIFRLILSLLHVSLLDGIGNYAHLDDVHRLALPIIAVILIIIVAKFTGFKHYRMGIPFVIHRVKQFYGHIPLRTTINQFFGGILALASGFVVGKEGPTVHLAASASHYVGRFLRLPFNSLRILAGCGIAAGISAAFNTPFAAVIFVMEVVLREYKVHIFIPIMLAAACGSVLTRAVFGDVSELSFLNFEPVAVSQLPYLVLMGAIIGIFASAFNKQLMWTMQIFRPVNMIGRLLIAAVITGTMGYFMPQSLGAEFINVDKLLTSDFEVSFLVAIFAAKFFLAVVAIALGVPGGIIGAVMVIGMLLGVLLLQPLNVIIEHDMTTTYALLGLAGFLAAVLHAPMAALSAAMELAASPQAVLPSMIVIVSAYVTAKQLCNNKSVFIQQLDYQNLPYTTSPIRDMLQQTGVLAMMKTDIKHFSMAQDKDLYDFLQAHPDKTVINQASDKLSSAKIVELNISLDDNQQPITMHETIVLSEQHTIADVHDVLQTKRQGAVIVVDHNQSIIGVITWNMVHNYLLRQQH